MGGIKAEKPHRATLRKCTVSSSSPPPSLPLYITRYIVFKQQRSRRNYQDNITKYMSPVPYCRLSTAAPNDGFLQKTLLKTLFRLSRVLLDV